MKKFTKKERLLKRKEYKELYDKGKKIHTQYFVLIYSKNEKQNSRLGITVTKKVGKAFFRNKIKRHCREFFRLNKNNIPENIDINIIAKNKPYLWIQNRFSNAREHIQKNVLTWIPLTKELNKQFFF